MLWTWIVMAAWLGSMLGVLILVVGVLFSGESLYYRRPQGRALAVFDSLARFFQQHPLVRVRGR